MKWFHLVIALSLAASLITGILYHLAFSWFVAGGCSTMLVLSIVGSWQVKRAREIEAKIATDRIMASLPGEGEF